MRPHASLRAGFGLGCLIAGLILGFHSPAVADPAADSATAATAATAASPPAPAAATAAPTESASTPAPAAPPPAAPPAPTPPAPAPPLVDPKAAISFEHDIRPIFKAYCFDCHGAEAEHKAGLDLRLRRLVVKGGESGPAIVPGDAGGQPARRKAACRRNAADREEGSLRADRPDRSLDRRRRTDPARRAGRRRAGRRSRPRSGAIGPFSRRRCRRFPRSRRPIGCGR